MNFEIRPPDALLVHDSQPGNHATVFGPDGKILGRRPEFDSFDDGRRTYTWGFAYGAVHEGDEFVFTTADRVVVGVCRGGAIGLTDKTVEFVRDPIGKPLFVKRPRIVPSPPRVTAPVTRVDSDEPLVKLVTLGGKTGMVANKTPAQQKPTNSMRCLFLNPSVPYGNWNCYRTGMMNEASFSAHGMAYVSAALKRDGHECWLLDMRSMESWAHLEQSIRAQDYDVVFVGFLSIDAFNAAGAVRLLKEVHPDKPVIVGGLHVSIAKERVFPRADLIEYYCWNNYDIVPTVFKEFLAWKGESKFDTKNFPLADFVILDDGEIAAQNLVSELSNGRWPSERTIEGGAVPMEIARHLDRDLFNLEIEANSPILPMQPVPMITTTWARGCPFRCSYCFTPGMIVHTEYGFEEIASVVRRDEPVRVVQADGSLGQAVTFSERSYRGSIVRVRTHYMNQPLEATPNHKVKARTKAGLWVDKAVEDLTLGDRLFVPSPKGESVPAIDVERLLREGGDEPQKIGDKIRLRDGKNSIPAFIPWSDDMLFLLGIYLAEGCATYSSKRPNSVAAAWTFGGHETHLQEKTIRLIEKVFGVEARPQEQKTGIQVWCGVGVVAKVFEYLCGPCSDKKKLHSWLLGLPNDAFGKIAVAYLVGDGNPGALNTPNSYASASTVSASLAWGMWTRLLGCGAAVGLHKKKRPLVCSEIEGRPVKIEEFFYELNFMASEVSAELVHEAFGEAGRVPSRLMFPLEFCEGGALLPIENLETAYCSDPVFNMEVTPDHTYTVNGCAVHNCNLASQLSNSNVRTKPPELVEEELDQLYHRFAGNFGSIMIHDDLTFDSKHIAQWCELILRKYNGVSLWLQSRADWVIQRYRRQRDFWELLCRAGLTWVSVGYESGSQRMLDYMQKDNTVENNKECGRILDEYGINSFGNFLWGCPTETHEEAEETVKLVQEIRPGFLSGSIYCNFPGTQMDTKCRAEGLLEEGQVYARSHLPWQITVKGIDYAHRVDCITRAGQSANYLRMPKLVSEDIKRKLAASSRGLAIH